MFKSEKQFTEQTNLVFNRATFSLHPPLWCFMVGVEEVFSSSAAFLLTHLKPAFLEGSHGLTALRNGAPRRGCICQILPSRLEKCGRTTTTSCAAAPLLWSLAFVCFQHLAAPRVEG